MNSIRRQDGFTLIEVLIALGIAALITTALGTAIFQILDRTAKGGETVRALNDIQNAGQWLYLDGERAETTDLIENDPPVSSMVLNWVTDGNAHTATYTISGTELLRDHNGVVTTVARYVSNADFSISNRLITVNLTSTTWTSGIISKTNSRASRYAGKQLLARR